MRWYLRRFFRANLVLFVIILSLFLAFRVKYRDVIRELAQTQVKNTTSDLTNDAIARQIAAGHIQYDRIVYFEKDLDGRITALKTNMPGRSASVRRRSRRVCRFLWKAIP